MFEKILVPLDSSSMAEQALPYVVELARSFHSAVDIVYVCEAHRVEGSSVCQAYLDDVAAKIISELSGQDEKIKTNLVMGSPGQKILDYAQAEKIDLIIMSSHGHSGVTLWPMGGTAEKVLRKTGKPLIIVKVKEAQGPAPQVDLFKRILVPLDGSELGSTVVPYVDAIAGKFESEVILFHVVETDKHLHTLGRIDSVPIREEEMDSLRKRSNDYLNREKDKFSNSKATVSSVVKEGNVAEEIIRYGDENNCSLIAISSHGHSGFEAWIIGSVTNKVLHASHKSLLFIPALEK
jgi:nucleotide-binding universal stress UspA family protein